MTLATAVRPALLAEGAGRTAARVAGLAVVKVFALLLLVFLALDVLPGDAASQRLGLSGSPEQVAALRQEYGLDRPALLRFVDWLAGLPVGDLGTVVVTGKPVAEVIAGPLSRTLLLLVVAGTGVLLLGVGGGILAGLREGRPTDRVLSAGALAVVCTPEFVVGTLLVLLLAAGLGWFPAVSLVPVGGSVLDEPVILVLPALAVALAASGLLLRQVRSVVQRQNRTVHVESARLAGLPEHRVVLRHVLPGASGPIAQATAAVVPYLLGGTVVIETLFVFPGLGSLMVQAVSTREPDLLLACALVVVTVTVTAFTIADLVGRARREEARL